MDRRELLMLTGSLAVGLSAAATPRPANANVPASFKGPYIDLTTGKGNMLAAVRIDANLDESKQKWASVSGTVIERRVTEGQVVQPADTVYVVADLSRIWVVADIPEQSAGLVAVGESVAVEIAAFAGRRIPGALSFVSPIVSPETRTVRARIDLSNAEREYKPAMLASMLIRGKAQRKLTVPAAAVVREENRDYVFVQAAPGRYALRPVSLGTEYEERRAVHAGLTGDEQVVVEGAFHLNNERKRQLLEGN